MNELLARVVQFGLWCYGYCTDFVINMANLSGTSYYEANAFLFCFLWPLVTLVLISYWMILRYRLYRMEKGRS